MYIILLKGWSYVDKYFIEELNNIKTTSDKVEQRIVDLIEIINMELDYKEQIIRIYNLVEGRY